MREQSQGYAYQSGESPPKGDRWVWVEGRWLQIPVVASAPPTDWERDLDGISLPVAGPREIAAP
jgi:hypothetical protein